ncbi:ribosomal RNA small subunit methyltransferase B [Elysia marginata]|uniref:Ribosomal RNA small subunit methyltransferase B n=1 Tax=Elysia marginata TaxID=1093978 RepID=A0AAV4GSP9_9GAST|nr:ribosomal RNA small subunit methyltransferase B [Elysia marginata]
MSGSLPHPYYQYCDLGPVPRRSPAPTPGALDMLHRVQAYRGHPVQQLGFITASTTFDAKENLDRLLLILTQPPMFTTLRVDLSKISAREAQHEIMISLKEQSMKTGLETFSMFWHAEFQDCLVLHNRGPNTVEKVDKEMMVDLACGMAVLRGAHVFVQGIMAAPPGKKLFIGNGVSQVSRSDVFNAYSRSVRGVGVLMTQPVFEAPCLAELSFPWLVPQNLPSIACVHALAPQPGELVLDMCAAPGGKTSHIAALMANQGKIVALEKSSERAKKLEQLGLQNVHVFAYDATKALSQDLVPQAERVFGPPFPPSSFDRILVDAPCSALGQRPCYVNRISVNQLMSFPVIQHKLLMVAAELLRPGGVLVYSTCTITLAENEEQVAKFLARRADMKLVAPSVRLGSCGLEGSQLDATQRAMVQRYDPGMLLADRDSRPSQDLHNVDTIGFFIAKFVKHKEEDT